MKVCQPPTFQLVSYIFRGDNSDTKAYEEIESERLNGKANQLNNAYLSYIEIALRTLNGVELSNDEKTLFNTVLTKFGNGKKVQISLSFKYFRGNC